MKISKSIRFVLGGLALGLAVSLSAQDRQEDFEGLGLSEAQLEQVAKIQETSRANRGAILAKHGIVMKKGERPDRELMSKAQPEMRAERQASMEKIKSVLSPEQLAKVEERMQGARKKGAAGGPEKKNSEMKKKKKEDA